MNDLVVLTCKESNPLLIPAGEDSAVLGVRDTMGVIGDGDGLSRFSWTNNGLQFAIKNQGSPNGS